jgi:hypothetical protein
MLDLFLFGFKLVFMLIAAIKIVFMLIAATHENAIAAIK